MYHKIINTIIIRVNATVVLPTGTSCLMTFQKQCLVQNFFSVLM